MTVRLAVAADVPAIRSIQNALIRETTVTFNPVEKSEAEIAALVDEKRGAGQGVFVAEQAGAVVGLAYWGAFRNGPGYRHTAEHSIVLSRGARGHGLGRALMGAVEESCRAAGVHTLWAGVSGENPEGLAFHRALGFVEVARLEEVGRKFERWLDLDLLVKRL